MPRYTAEDQLSAAKMARITSVKLDGREVLKPFDSLDTLYIKAADTDEGWLDAYETYDDDAGRKRLRMSELEPDPKQPEKMMRTLIVKRLHGKVEVFFGDLSS